MADWIVDFQCHKNGNKKQAMWKSSIIRNYADGHWKRWRLLGR